MRLSKKFRLLENDVENLEEKLIATPKLGERHQTLRNWHLIKKAFAAKISIFQKLLFVLFGFGLLFINIKVAFIYLIVFFAIIAFLEYGQRKAK